MLQRAMALKSFAPMRHSVSLPSCPLCSRGISWTLPLSSFSHRPGPSGDSPAEIQAETPVEASGSARRDLSSEILVAIPTEILSKHVQVSSSKRRTNQPFRYQHPYQAEIEALQYPSHVFQSREPIKKPFGLLNATAKRGTMICDRLREGVLSGEMIARLR